MLIVHNSNIEMYEIENETFPQYLPFSKINLMAF